MMRLKKQQKNEPSIVVAECESKGALSVLAFVFLLSWTYKNAWMVKCLQTMFVHQEN